MNEERGETGPQPPDLRMVPPTGEFRPPPPVRGSGHPAPPPTPSRGQPRHAGPPPPGTAVRPPAEDVVDDLVIRPFLLTGGRTRPGTDGLRVETLIQSDPSRPHAALRFEARQIVELCFQPISVAEIGSALRLPLGVVRVLVSDLVAGDQVTIAEREQLSVQMIERIRDRVRAL